MRSSRVASSTFGACAFSRALCSFAALTRRARHRLALPPGVDVAALAAARPALLLSAAPGAGAAAALEALATLLPASARAPAALAALLAAEPAFLDAAAVRCAVRELQALVPGCDAGAMLAADPALLRRATPPPPRALDDEYAI